MTSPFKKLFASSDWKIGSFKQKTHPSLQCESLLKVSSRGW